MSSGIRIQLAADEQGQKRPDKKVVSKSQSHKTFFGVHLLTLFQSYIFLQDRIIMVTLIEWSSLQKSVSKFMPKKFDAIYPRAQC
jgi:hypothetical protein